MNTYEQIVDLINRDTSGEFSRIINMCLKAVEKPGSAAVYTTMQAVLDMASCVGKRSALSLSMITLLALRDHCIESGIPPEVWANDMIWFLCAAKGMKIGVREDPSPDRSNVENSTQKGA